MIKISQRLRKPAETYIIASTKSWIEGEAERQLKQTATLDGTIRVVGLPDIHPGKGAPVGAAFLTENIIYPFLLGNDVGCGMGLWKTGLKKSKIKRDKWAKKLTGLELPLGEVCDDLLLRYGIEKSENLPAMGTIGGGNHFVELLSVETLCGDQEGQSETPDKNHLYLMVHSGSRGLGEMLLRNHTEKRGAEGVGAASVEGVEYLRKHDQAVLWAKANREAVANRIISKLGTSMEPVLDLTHNSVTRVSSGDREQWLHRKGAAPSDSGPVIIPGSRGSFSYLVRPVGDQSKNLLSVAHGAGRKWNRSSARVRFKSAGSATSLLKTELGSTVICEEKNLLHEEAPKAYKNIEVVIGDLLAAGLIEIMAKFRPVITYKVRRQR